MQLIRRKCIGCHFTGSQVEEYLAHYELPNDKNVFFTGTSPDYQWLYNQMIQELQLHRVNREGIVSEYC